MKIVTVSRDPSKLESMRDILAVMPVVSTVEAVPGPLSAAAGRIVRAEAEVLLLDCTQDAAAELDALETLLHVHRHLHVVLVVDHESTGLLLRAMRMGVREVIPMPLDGESVGAAVRRVAAHTVPSASATGRVLAFTSAKGGAGATFIAANLGYALAARTGRRVMLLDLNLQFGDASMYVTEWQPASSVAELLRNASRLDAALLNSATLEVAPNYSVLAAPEDPAQGVDAQPAQIDALIRLARTVADYVLLDVGRSLDPVSVQALDAADTIHPVLEATLPVLRDAKRMTGLFRSLGYGPDRVMPIVNRLERGGTLGLEDIEKVLGLRVYATLPNHYASVSASVNQGVPIEKLSPSSPVARGLRDIAARIHGAANDGTARSGWFGRLISRRGA